MISTSPQRRHLPCRAMAGVLITLLAACDPGEAPPSSEVPPSSDASSAAETAADANAGEAAVAPRTEVEAEAEEGQGITAGGNYLVRWRSGPEGIPALEPFSLEVEVEQAGGVPLAEDAVVRVDAAMPHHGHGMNFVPEISRLAPGRYEVEGMLFHMRGRWELFVDVERDGVLERAQWTVELE